MLLKQYRIYYFNTLKLSIPFFTHVDHFLSSSCSPYEIIFLPHVHPLKFFFRVSLMVVSHFCWPNLSLCTVQYYFCV